MKIINSYTPQDESFCRHWMYNIKKLLMNRCTFQQNPDLLTWEVLVFTKGIGCRSNKLTALLKMRYTKNVLSTSFFKKKENTFPLD